MLPSLSQTCSIEHFISCQSSKIYDAKSQTPSFPSSEKIQEAITFVLHHSTPEELHKSDLTPLVNRCYKKLTEHDLQAKSFDFERTLKENIDLEIINPEFPIEPEILDRLILDEEWEGAILTLGLHRYVGRLLSTEVEQIGKKFLSFSDQEITSIVASALSDPIHRKELKSTFKDSTFKEKKVRLSLTVTLCYQEIWNPIGDNLIQDIVTLPQRHFTKQEIADKKLPCGRNMLREFNADECNQVVYHNPRLASRIVDLYLAKEKETLTARIETAVKTFIKKSSKYKKMKII